MPVLKKNVSPLLENGIESLTLAIELFNRPNEVARTHGVLMLLQHAFEMLLKAVILQRTGSIHEREQKYSYGFDRCLTIAEQELKILTDDERATLSILDRIADPHDFVRYLDAVRNSDFFQVNRTGIAGGPIR